MENKFAECPNCKTFAFLASHKCPPVFEWCADLSENEWQSIHALDEEQAAEKAAAAWHNSDTRADQVEVYIRQPGAKRAIRFIVDIEFVPSFTARYLGRKAVDLPALEGAA
jgi:hypothetical protein